MENIQELKYVYLKERNKMNINEIKETLNYLLDNNLKLQEEGLDKISINLEGHAGIAKTSIVKQVAEERGAKYVRINLAELEEIGDLVGIPQKQYVMRNETNEVLVSEKVVNQYINMGYRLCPDCDPQMTYAIPSWVPKDADTEVILCLDDFLRGSMLFQQAIMSLIQFGEYISWKLPNKCHIILTSNPGDEYTNLSELDDAQQSRMLTFNVEFDVNIWAKWAEAVGIREEFINFALYAPEIFDRGHIINARSYTLFANALNSVKELSAPASMCLANSVAMGAFGKDGEYVGGMFAQFINNKLDKLISPKEMISAQKFDDLVDKLKGILYTDSNYNAAIASILTIRLINYIETRFEANCEKKESDQIIKRLTELCLHKGVTLLTVDLLYKLIRDLNGKYRSKCTKLMSNPEIAMKLMS